MEDKYKDDIIRLLSNNGAMGVNALSRELNVPLSTLQKYLHKQSYFKINNERKWNLPEKVVSDIKSNTLGLMTDMVQTNVLLLKSQLEEMLQTVDNALSPIGTLKRGIEHISAPVANSDNKQISNIDRRLVEIYNKGEILTNVYKKQKHNIPEEYQEIIFGFDYVGFILKENEDYFNEALQEPLYELLSGRTTKLEPEIIEVLKEHQKDTTEN